jgi:hypothetical protein
MVFIGEPATSPARFRLVAQRLVPTLNYPSSGIRRAARNGINPVFFPRNKKAGSSGSTIAIPSAATAEWLFHQEKATLRDLGQGT